MQGQEAIAKKIPSAGQPRKKFSSLARFRLSRARDYSGQGMINRCFELLPFWNVVLALDRAGKNFAFKDKINR